MTHNDNLALSVDSWWLVYTDLKGTAWEDDDLRNAWEGRDDRATRLAAEALRYVHTCAQSWQGADPDEAPMVAVIAAYEIFGDMLLVPGRVKQMADSFAVFYKDIDDPLDEFLDERCAPVQLHWLSETGRRELEAFVIKPSELWLIEGRDNVNGVWVFNKPSSRH